MRALEDLQHLSDSIPEQAERVGDGSPHAGLAEPFAPAETAVLNRRECARWLGVSTRQLARLDVPCTRLGHAVRYPVRVVLRWLEDKAVAQ